MVRYYNNLILDEKVISTTLLVQQQMIENARIEIDRELKILRTQTNPKCRGEFQYTKIQK